MLIPESFGRDHLIVHTTGRSGTSVTSLLGLLVTTLAEVISAGVYNNSTLHNYQPSIRANQLTNRVGKDLRR